jgi:hypothetical protein
MVTGTAGRPLLEYGFRVMEQAMGGMSLRRTLGRFGPRLPDRREIGDQGRA